MSSSGASPSDNYLNYELSKELKELGVEFKVEGGWTWVLKGNQYSIRYGYFIEEYSLPKPEIITFAAPSTAQLADEIRKRGGFRLQGFNGQGFTIQIPVGDLYKELEDLCLTTALGKALIALVFAERSEDRRCESE